MYGVIILAAGIGSRMNLGYNKMLLKIDEKPIYMHTLDKFKDFNEIVLVVNEADNINPIDGVKIVIGGKSRGESVYNGLKYINSEYVLIHDGARPYIDLKTIKEFKNELSNYDALAVATKVKDTIKEYKNGIIKTLNRDDLIAMQTPQGGKTELFKKCYELEKKDGFTSTDDIQVIEKYSNAKIGIVYGNYSNIKITTIEDVRL